MVPDSLFKKNIISIYGERGNEWLSELPILLARISKKYNLSHIISFKNLSYNYVASALQDKNNVVIKLGIDFQDLKKEA